MHNEKIIRSGRLLEIEYYPCFSDGRALPCRDKKQNPTGPAQEKYNRKVAQKKLTRLINCNFTEDDYFMSPTYRPDYAPADETAARRDMTNYIRRVKRRRESELKKLEKELKAVSEKPLRRQSRPSSPVRGRQKENDLIKENARYLRQRIRQLRKPLRYIYVIESQTYKTGKFAGKTNYHFHMMISGGLDQRVMESLWVKGMRVSCDNYMPERFGPEAVAKYMSKDPRGKKSFCYSQNLKKPKVKLHKKQYSSGYVDNMCRMRVDDSAFWERKFKGFRFLGARPLLNEYNGRMYLTVTMFAGDGGGIPPEFDYE